MWNSTNMLLTCHTSAADWFDKGRAMCNHVYVIMHVIDPSLPIVRVGHRVPLVGFCLSLYGLHVLNRDVNMIQTNKQTNKQTKAHAAYNVAQCPPRR